MSASTAEEVSADPTGEVSPAPVIGVSDQTELSSGPVLVLGLDVTTWRWMRKALLGAYVVTTYIWLQAWGKVPSDREYIVGWIVGLCLLATIGRRWKEAVLVVASWMPFLLALYLYDFARSVGYRLGRPIAVTPQIAVDRFLGFGRLPTERLQSALYNPRIRGYDVGVSIIYQSHFIVPYVAAGLLWRYRRLWRWYAASFVSITFSACVVFAVWGTAPPWYAASAHKIAWYRAKLPSDKYWPRELAGRGWRRVGLHFASRLIQKGQETVNPFAAIPSLHSAEALLVILMVWKLIPHAVRWIRPLLLLYPVAMAFALVYSGEHYLIDVFVGWGFVATALTVGWWLRQRNRWASPWAAPYLTAPDRASADASVTAAGRTG